MSAEVYHHQDWEPVILKKRQVGLAPETKRKISQLEPTHIRQLKSDDAEVFKNKMFELEFVRSVIQRRATKKMTQKDLARHLNVDASIIQRLEQGKLVYDAGLKGRINRALA